MRAARLVQLLLLLQTRGNMSAPELARELEVSVRTIYRDLEALSGAGVPVYCETGRGGGARLVDGYRTRLTGLTTDEADAVLLGGIPGPAAELGLGTVLAAAQLKVLAALPPELRGRATRVRERFHLDAPGWFQRTEALPQLATIADALWADRRIAITYERPDTVVSRTLDPLGLVMKAGVWYLVARTAGDTRTSGESGTGGDPRTAGDTRTYRVSRITEARRLEEGFDRPAGFDLADHWTESSGAFERASQHIEVALLIHPDELRWLRHAIGEAAHQAAAASAAGASERDDGRIEVRFPSERVETASRALLQMGEAVEVIEPPELRERLASTAWALAARYSVTA